MSEPYYTHPTVRAVASVVHDKLDVEGGVKLLRASSRVRMTVAGTAHDDARVAMALDNEGWIATTEIVDAIIRAVQQAADDNLPR
jgi:hypothetical protein